MRKEKGLLLLLPESICKMKWTGLHYLAIYPGDNAAPWLARGPQIWRKCSRTLAYDCPHLGPVHWRPSTFERTISGRMSVRGMDRGVVHHSSIPVSGLVMEIAHKGRQTIGVNNHVLVPQLLHENGWLVERERGEGAKEPPSLLCCRREENALHSKGLGRELSASAIHTFASVISQYSRVAFAALTLRCSSSLPALSNGPTFAENDSGSTHFLVRCCCCCCRIQAGSIFLVCSSYASFGLLCLVVLCFCGNGSLRPPPPTLVKTDHGFLLYASLFRS
jgi:hypothetical protein